MARKELGTTSNHNDHEMCHYGDSEITVVCMTLCFLIIVSVLACVFRQMFQNMFTAGNNIITYLTTYNVRNNIQMAPVERAETINGSLAIENMMRNIEISQEHTDSTVYDCTLEVISRVKDEAKHVANELKASATELTQKLDTAVSDNQETVREVKCAVQTGIESLRNDFAVVDQKIESLRISPTKTANEENYLRKSEELRNQMVLHYNEILSYAPTSPLLTSKDEHLFEFYIPPKIFYTAHDKRGRLQEKVNVMKYKHILFKHNDTLDRRIFIQGEPGKGKSTFLAKLVLDWCAAQSRSVPNEFSRVSNKSFCKFKAFADVHKLRFFKFHFLILLRDSMEHREIVEMIKEQIIDRIYPAGKREEFYDILNLVLEKEKCIVELDGLDEWSDPQNKVAIPALASCYSRCTLLITTRPWKLVDERIKDSQVNNLFEIDGILGPEELVELLLRGLDHKYPQHARNEVMKYIRKNGLSHFLTSPLLITMLVSLWNDNIHLSGSLCEIYSILLDTLFKKANKKKGCFTLPPVYCFTNTMHLKPNLEVLDSLAKAAFHFLVSNKREASIVFSEFEVIRYLTEEQKALSLKAGILSARKCASKIVQHSTLSFLHKSVQEFLAAFYIAKCSNEIDVVYSLTKTATVLDLEQLFLYLCGLNIQIANKIQLFLVNSTFRTLEHNQDLTIRGYTEAKANQQIDVKFHLTEFAFHGSLNKTETSALKEILRFNKSNVRSLFITKNALEISDIVESLTESAHSLTQLEIEIYPSTHLPRKSVLACLLHNMPVQLNRIIVSSNKHIKAMVKLDGKFRRTFIFRYRLTPDEMRGLLDILAMLDYSVECKIECTIFKSHVAQQQSDTQVMVPELKKTRLSNIKSNLTLKVKSDCLGLYEALRGANIQSLEIRKINQVALFLQTLQTLRQLDTISIKHIFFHNINIPIAPSLRYIVVRCESCSVDRLRSFVNRFLEKRFSDEFSQAFGFVQHFVNEEQPCDKSYKRLTLEVCKDSPCLNELSLNATIMSLVIAKIDNVGLCLETVPKLNTLRTLILGGLRFDEIELQLPACLHYLTLLGIKCSSKWLRTLLVRLSNLRHPVICKLIKCVVKLCDEKHSHLLSRTLEIPSPDKPNVTLKIRKDSQGLYEALRYSSIRRLQLRSIHYSVGALETMSTLKTLETLTLKCLRFEHIELQIPLTLRSLCLQYGKYSSDWLVNLLVKFSSIGHPVRCQLVKCEVTLRENVRQIDYHMSVSDSMILRRSCDMSNVTLEITKDSPGLFETLLETSIRDLKLIRFSYESNVFAIVPTLRKLKSLTLIGCHCKIDTLILPLSLQTLCLVKSHGSFARNLKSCLVKLANLRHPVTFKLYECGIDPLVDNEPNKNEMFNIVMEVCNNSPGLHGILQGTSIRGLKIRGINNVTELLLTVPTLGHLEILSVEGIHLNRFQLQFPKSLKYICFPRCSFSPIGMLGLLLQLAVIGHPVKCEFLNCEAISGKNMHASEYEFSELLNNVLHDMSEINLVAKFSPGLRDMLNAITTICHNMQKVKYIPGC